MKIPIRFLKSLQKFKYGDLEFRILGEYEQYIDAMCSSKHYTGERIKFDKTTLVEIEPPKSFKQVQFTDIYVGTKFEYRGRSCIKVRGTLRNFIFLDGEYKGEAGYIREEAKVRVDVDTKTPVDEKENLK